MWRRGVMRTRARLVGLAALESFSSLSLDVRRPIERDGNRAAMSTGRNGPPPVGAAEADLRATRERQARLRHEVRHLNECQQTLRAQNRGLRKAIAAATVMLDIGLVDEARELLVSALGATDQVDFDPEEGRFGEAAEEPLQPA